MFITCNGFYENFLKWKWYNICDCKYHIEAVAWYEVNNDLLKESQLVVAYGLGRVDLEYFIDCVKSGPTKEGSYFHELLSILREDGAHCITATS